MTINFDAEDTFYTASCWDSRGFTDYCSLTDAAKCSLNGTKGKGTTGKGATSRWYDGVNKTHTGGPGSTLLDQSAPPACTSWLAVLLIVLLPLIHDESCCYSLTS